MKPTLLIKFAIAMGIGLGACGSEQAMPGDDLVIPGVSPQSVQPLPSEDSLSPDLDGSLTDIPSAQPSAADSCEHCEGRFPFKGDGVKIHSCASTTCTVLGLGYRSQRQATICILPYRQNGFGRIQNRNTDVRGWAALQYVTIACD